jgi:hypothetical protein
MYACIIINIVTPPESIPATTLEACMFMVGIDIGSKSIKLLLTDGSDTIYGERDNAGPQETLAYDGQGIMNTTTRLRAFGHQGKECSLYNE